MVLLSAAAFGEELVPWQRQAAAGLGDGVCGELVLGRVGSGVLELRFFEAGTLALEGADPKRGGASVFVAAEDPQRPTLALYHPSGIYARSAQVPGPLRFGLRAGALCLASGEDVIACGTVLGSIDGVLQMPSGRGWEARIVPCAPFAMPARSKLVDLLVAGLVAAPVLFAWRRMATRRARAAVGVLGAAGLYALALAFDPLGTSRWLPPGLPVAACGLVGAASLLLPGRRRVARVWLLALAVFMGGAIALAPHPVRVRAPAPPIAPALWHDTAHWHPRALHQELATRERPLTALRPDRETWLVVGGSVAFGDGVSPEEAFPAVAERLLRHEGREIDVLNGGAQGWNVGNVDALLQAVGPELPLTGIVLVSILNNASFPVVGLPGACCDRGFLAAYACNQLRSIHFFQWPKALLPKPGNEARHADALRRLLAREQALGRRIVLMDEVTAAELAGETDWWLGFEPVRRTTRNVAGSLGLTLEPVTEAFRSISPADAFLDGIHPSPEGHRQLGELLRRILSEPRAG